MSINEAILYSSLGDKFLIRLLVRIRLVSQCRDLFVRGSCQQSVLLLDAYAIHWHAQFFFRSFELKKSEQAVFYIQTQANTAECSLSLDKTKNKIDMSGIEQLRIMCKTLVRVKFEWHLKVFQIVQTQRSVKASEVHKKWLKLRATNPIKWYNRQKLIWNSKSIRSNASTKMNGVNGRKLPIIVNRCQVSVHSESMTRNTMRHIWFNQKGMCYIRFISWWTSWVGVRVYCVHDV